MSPSPPHYYRYATVQYICTFFFRRFLTFRCRSLFVCLLQKRDETNDRRTAFIGRVIENRIISSYFWKKTKPSISIVQFR